MAGAPSLPFEDREDGAKQLLARLRDLEGQKPLVLAVPRGAVPMAKIIAEGLGGDLDVVLVKKIGHPLQPEFAIGSVSETGEIIFSDGANEIGLSKKDIEENAITLSRQLAEKRLKFGLSRPPIDPENRIVIIVDDGIATGATMAAAVQSLKSKGAKRVIATAPVASAQAVELLELKGAEVRVLAVPKHFGAVGFYYRNFNQVSDAEVKSILR